MIGGKSVEELWNEEKRLIELSNLTNKSLIKSEIPEKKDLINIFQEHYKQIFTPSTNTNKKLILDIIEEGRELFYKQGFFIFEPEINIQKPEKFLRTIKKIESDEINKKGFGILSKFYASVQYIAHQNKILVSDKQVIYGQDETKTIEWNLDHLTHQIYVNLASAWIHQNRKEYNGNYFEVMKNLDYKFEQKYNITHLFNVLSLCTLMSEKKPEIALSTVCSKTTNLWAPNFSEPNFNYLCYGIISKLANEGKSEGAAMFDYITYEDENISIEFEKKHLYHNHKISIAKKYGIIKDKYLH